MTQNKEAPKRVWVSRVSGIAYDAPISDEFDCYVLESKADKNIEAVGNAVVDALDPCSTLKGIERTDSLWFRDRDKQRRRELFEKVAVRHAEYIEHVSGFGVDLRAVGELIDDILCAADRYAEGKLEGDK